MCHVEWLQQSIDQNPKLPSLKKNVNNSSSHFVGPKPMLFSSILWLVMNTYLFPPCFLTTSMATFHLLKYLELEFSQALNNLSFGWNVINSKC
jgi:hypothetical protein